MKLNSTKIFSLLLSFLFLFVQIKAQTVNYKTVFEEAKATGFSGVVLVAKDGKPIFFESAGKRIFETDETLKRDDIFELASVSKQFTAMIIMMLKERGKLDFDDSINKYVQIPYQGITIRHLLTHTSGLPDYQAIMDKYWDKSKVAGNKDILEHLNRYAPPVLFQPGEKYSYSNTGYVLLASIAEKAADKDFIEMCREWIFKPLKMRDTDIRTLEEKAKVNNFAVGHQKDDKGNYVNANKFRSSDYTVWLGNRKGSGRISSTAQDLLKWDAALYTEKLIKKATLEEAFTNAVLKSGEKVNYGFGWEILTDKSGRKYVQHTGDNPGYRTIIVRFISDKRTIIVLCNNAHQSMQTLIEKLKG
jgi:CubicO group peptidase (beta-lactamase class C family)